MALTWLAGSGHGREVLLRGEEPILWRQTCEDWVRFGVGQAEPQEDALTTILQQALHAQPSSPQALSQDKLAQ